MARNYCGQSYNYNQGPANEREEPMTKPLPPVSDETGPQLLQRLGDDAEKWAIEFNKTAVKIGYSSMDIGWLLSWFANAIEHSTDVRNSRAVPTGFALVPVEPTEKMIDEVCGFFMSDNPRRAASNVYKAMIAAASGEKG